MYQQPTYLPSPIYNVKAVESSAGMPFTATMRDYVGHVHYAQVVLPSSHRSSLTTSIQVQLLPGSSTAVPNPSNLTLKPARYCPGGTKFDPSSNTISFDLAINANTGSTYVVLQFERSTEPLFIFIEPPVASPPEMTDPGVVSLLDFNIKPGVSINQRHGDAIQAAINEVMRNASLHTLVFPFVKGSTQHCTYLSHDLHINNSTEKDVTLYFEEGVLLQRDGSHTGPLTSPGFFTIFNSTGVSLRGYGTLDALNSGQGVYVSQSSRVLVEGLTVRCVHSVVLFSIRPFSSTI
jgi:hypothetical protein